MAHRVGIHDVARTAGVSPTTVSQALNGRGKISASTRDRVHRIARDLGYEPNRIASALRRQRTGILGFVSDEIATTPYAGRIVQGAQDAAAELGMTLMVVNSNSDPAVEHRQIEVLRAQQVDALVYATMFHRVVEVPSGLSGLPFVLVNCVDGAQLVSAVVPDESGAATAATQALVDAGHRRIAHITIDRQVPSVTGRESGYRQVLADANLPAHSVATSSLHADAEAGRRAIHRVLDAHPDTTAVFAYNDQMAMGVYQEAIARGLRIPEDLAVVGVDNLELIADALQPGLTTLALPHYEMGRWGVREAVAMVDAADDRPVARAVLECSFVVRGSITSTS